jgi:YD repeat-containing protein
VALWDDAGTVLHANHDPARMTARVWDRDGAQTIFRHAAGKAVLERIAPAGPSQGFYYDEAERLIGHSRDDGTIRTFQRLDPATMELSHIDGDRLAFVEYDEGGGATAIASADETRIQLENGADGLPRAIIDGLGERWAFERDRQGRVTAIASPEGRRLTLRWSRQHRQAEGPAGAVRRDSLDESGRTVLSSIAGGSERRYVYDPEGRLVQAASGGFAVEFLYDRDGYLVSTVDTERRRYRVAVDLHGQASDAELDGRRFSVRYDAAGRLLGIAEGEGRRAVARYDTRDRLAQIDGPAGPVVTYTYDDDDTVTARGAAQEARYSASGALLAHTRGATRDAYTYGSAGELLVWTRSENGLDRTAIFEYDAAAPAGGGRLGPRRR